MNLRFLNFTIAIVLFGYQAFAAPTRKTAGNKRTTDVSFDDVLVQGKYQFSDEAITTVESDKVLDGLLNIPTDFKDRLKKSRARK